MTAPLDRHSFHSLSDLRLEPSVPSYQGPGERVPVSDGPRGFSINSAVAALVGLLIVVALVTFGGGAAANDPLVPVSPDSFVDDAIEIYVVQPGDTLWDIAGRLTSEGDDIRPVIDHLKVVAGGSDLEIGQRIVIDHAAIRG